MADAEAERAMAELRAAVAEFDRCQDVRDRLHQAIASALRAGNRPRDVTKEVPYDRNHVRRIADAAGVPALREPTVKPRDRDT
jgi:hypothetical protein